MEESEFLLHQIESNNLWTNELELKRNQLLLTKGQINSNLYFIISGSLRIYFSDEYEAHTIRFGYKNNFITALDSFITDLPSDLNIETLKKTKVKIISKKTFNTLINSSDKLFRI